MNPTLIRTFDDVVRYVGHLEERHPVPRDAPLLRSPGISRADLARLDRRLPGLPPDYRQLVERYDLRDVALGAFQLDPFIGRDDFVASLLELNSEANPLWTRMVELGVRQVAALEGDAVCVGVEPRAPAPVVWLEGFPPRGVAVHRAGPSFELAAVAAARLNALSPADPSDAAGSAAMADELEAGLRELGFAEDAVATWRRIAEIFA